MLLRNLKNVQLCRRNSQIEHWAKWPKSSQDKIFHFVISKEKRKEARREMKTRRRKYQKCQTWETPETESEFTRVRKNFPPEHHQAMLVSIQCDVKFNSSMFFLLHFDCKLGGNGCFSNPPRHIFSISPSCLLAGLDWDPNLLDK